MHLAARRSLAMSVTQNSGGNVGGVTPVPIPNTEVKPSRADGTPRETAWESRSLPDTIVVETPALLVRRGGFVFSACSTPGRLVGAAARVLQAGCRPGERRSCGTVSRTSRGREDLKISQVFSVRVV